MGLTIGQKCGRTLKLLRGVSQPRVFGALAAYGFRDSDLEEGWLGLRGAASARMNLPVVVAHKPVVYEKLDDLENRWFPICKASLERRFPDVAKRVFLNLHQTSGIEVSVSMHSFAQRIRQLEGGDQNDQAARALLEERGLNQSVLQEIEGLLRSLEIAPEAPAPVPDVDVVAAAENRMWAWYLEWGTIARTVIHDRRLLRSLGFLTSSGSEASDEDANEDDLGDEDAASPSA